MSRYGVRAAEMSDCTILRLPWMLDMEWINLAFHERLVLFIVFHLCTRTWTWTWTYIFYCTYNH